MSFEIIPAVVTADPFLLVRQIRQIEIMTNKAQIDFMDKRFVPLATVTPQDLALIAPIKTELTLIAHLMVLEPEKYLKPLAAAGIKKTIFHYEATSDPVSLIKSIRKEGMGVGVAIKLDTPTEVLEPLVPQVDLVVFLAVEPRALGSPFQPQVLDKIAAFRQSHPEAKHPKTRVGIDGGIRQDNIKLIKARGLSVDEVYVGTGIFAFGDPLKNFQALKDAAAD